ncbi:ZIP family metal transporter [Brevibacillus formosus]|uniref:ZIP family metal transporter n=1 Tax=Brevibacillus TaxID=55080 RepID=UPI000D0EAAC8|nr:MULTISPECIES: ZIP family metal transporter [Brevibacillus]MBG9944631.1 divalent heavy-metal cations transporter [Brevibacillus formosus]MED1947181.1 ZIP family metal transporter [Brevibacillus formosus]MED1997552.1 ZIP family metal transporter [Brevibacillus formosus]MED2083409.1 ZIP family metal transporter [Brevibacillus formosus]PSK16777.1 divalent heavy-metal cations transporter [Brevibacillus sp. NRRL NRS-603]
MMQSVFWIVLLTAALASSIGGLLLCLRAWSSEALFAMISAGAGLLLAITLLDLMPHVFSDKSLWLMPFVLVGFVTLFALELISKSSGEFGSTGMIGVMTGFLLHAFVEGVSLVASLRMDSEVGVSVLVAMLLHKIPDGVTIASLLLAATNSRKKAFLGATSLGIATIAGALSFGFAERMFPPNWSGIMLAMTTGIFLYVSASHLVPYIGQTKKAQYGVYFVGAMAVYLILSAFLHASHLHA